MSNRMIASGRRRNAETYRRQASGNMILTNEEIEKRRAAGIHMNRLNCGRDILPEDLAAISKKLDAWHPKTETEIRDKHICYLAFIKDMNGCQIARLNDPLIVGAGNRSKGKPLSGKSINKICNRYFPNLRQKKRAPNRTQKVRNTLYNARQQGNEIHKPKVCATCGAKGNIELHHIIPLALGGTNDYYNLIYLCHDCHMKLHHQLYDRLAK